MPIRDYQIEIYLQA